jgi:hypothetical protein
MGMQPLCKTNSKAAMSVYRKFMLLDSLHSKKSLPIDNCAGEFAKIPMSLTRKTQKIQIELILSQTD